MKNFFSEFKEFAVKGNVIDLAVAVIIGGAFGKIISSLVEDIIMPPVGWLVGGVNFTDWKFVLKPATVGADGATTIAAVSVNIGSFLQNVLDFLIIALAIFLMIKIISRLKKRLELITRREKAAEEKVAPLTKDQELLAEIRGLLRK